MRTLIDPAPIGAFLREHRMATLHQLKAALRTSSTMTVFRKLKDLGYLSSYSHRGAFYTLRDIPHFDQQGLWSFHEVRFSKHGNLIETARQSVQQSPAGFAVAELEELLHVQCKAALLKLHRQSRLARESIHGRHVYFSADPVRRRSQRLKREALGAEMSVSTAAMPQELKTAMVLFHSLLDEKQRRLHAGLEAFKLGHGGDQHIASLLALDRHTVAKGRRELLGGELSGERIRKPGAGRKPQEKKRLTSSNASKRS